MSGSPVEFYRQAFEAERFTGPDWLQDRRHAALASFSETGFPTRRQEAWKYTDVGAIARRQFHPATVRPGDVDSGLPEAARIAGLECHELPFINGLAADEPSHPHRLPRGVVVMPLERALEEHTDLVREYLGRDSGVARTAFTDLNDAFLRHGAFILVPDDVEADIPINLQFLASAQAEPHMAHLRTLIVLGKNARASVIESYFGADDSEYFCNTVTEAVVGRGARLDHYKVQQESRRAWHVGNLHVYQERDSRVQSHSVSLGGALARHDINVRLAAEGSGVELNGLYMASGRQHVDHHTCIDHEKPHTTSIEEYRGVLDGRARGVFNGRVVVRPDAQKIDAQQSNANLLLSDNAEIDTKPELEIYADDVKCSHGATVGRLDKDMLFYLRTRAIPEETARNLLTFAFADDVVSRIGIAPIRDRIESLVLGRLPDSARIREFVQ